MLKAPFPYFGGKSRVAELIWDRLGNVPNYVEPFFGSGAVLLARPSAPGIETVNDIDAYLANFWRAVQVEPETVADLMNWPVNESDLEARHKWLVTAARKAEHQQRMRDDPHYYDVKIAAWWCWGLCAWIGHGWCAGEYSGPQDKRNRGTGINIKDEKRGGQLPHLGNAGMGVHRKLPHLGDAGRGVHRQLPHLGNAGEGECARRGEVLRAWIQALADRLRNVRVCCGDWSRVCTFAPTENLGLTGVFLDPPYSREAGRDEELYAEDDLDVARAVRDWAVERGDSPLMRIALCGYEGEHVMPADWECVHWKAHGGYGVQRAGGNYVNKYRERVWFSPHCLKPELDLLAEAEPRT